LAGLLVVVVTIAIAGAMGDSSSPRPASAAPGERHVDHLLGGTPVGDKQDDADAKSNARNATSYVESCFATTQTYRQCASAAGSGVPNGGAAGQVQVTATSDSTYIVVAQSGSGTRFSIERSADGLMRRACSSPGRGGCMSTGTW
jgi:hypothetical protein